MVYILTTTTNDRTAEDWKIRRLEDWRIGRLEDWKIGNGGGIEVWKYRGMDGNGNGGTAAYGLLKNPADFSLKAYSL